MVTTPQQQSTVVVDIPLDRIKVTTRLRATDTSKVTDIAESDSGVGLLHPICVSQHGDKFHLLSGMHRLEAFRQLGRSTIPASINDADPLIEELIEVEENLVSSKLSAIDEAGLPSKYSSFLSHKTKEEYEKQTTNGNKDIQGTIQRSKEEAVNC